MILTCKGNWHVMGMGKPPASRVDANFSSSLASSAMMRCEFWATAGSHPSDSPMTVSASAGNMTSFTPNRRPCDNWRNHLRIDRGHLSAKLNFADICVGDRQSGNLDHLHDGPPDQPSQDVAAADV